MMLIRRLRRLQGNPRLLLRLRPACAEGAMRPEVTQGSHHIRYVAPTLTLRLVAGRKLFLAGVEMPCHLGLLGHSDADVLLHAITDALLGAAALGDIGTHFPDTDARFKGADSSVLLVEAARRVRAKGFEIGNVDSTIIAQAPKLAPYMAAICARVAQTLGVALDQVNVKAKTAEKMGAVGQGPAIKARAVVLLTL